MPAVNKVGTRHGLVDVALSQDLTARMRTYIAKANLKVGDYVFGKSPLSSFITKMNEKIGLTESAGVALFRRMNTPDDDAPMAEKIIAARKNKHGLGTAGAVYTRGKKRS